MLLGCMWKVVFMLFPTELMMMVDGGIEFQMKNEVTDPCKEMVTQITWPHHLGLVMTTTCALVAV